MKDRIIILGTQVDDDSANLVVGQLLHLAADKDDKDISLYINSPGGSATAMFAIYDAMQLCPCDVSTVCMGMAASAASVILAGGAPGKRFALPNSRVLIHQPHGGAQGQQIDIEIQAAEIKFLRGRMEELLALHTVSRSRRSPATPIATSSWAPRRRRSTAWSTTSWSASSEASPRLPPAPFQQEPERPDT